MFEIDTATGTFTCDQFVLHGDLEHDAFMKQLLDFQANAYTSERGTTVTHSVDIQIAANQRGFLTVFFFNQRISHLHINLENPNHVNWDEALAEQRWWERQQQWLPVIRQVTFSKLGSPHLLKTAELSDHDFPAPILPEREVWSYQYSWGTAGVGYVTDEWCFRFWTGYTFKH